MDWAVFLDRDGVINKDRKDYVKNWKEFRFIKGVGSALKQLTQAGIPIVVITNQSAVGRGLITEKDLSALHTRMCAAIKKAGGKIFKIYHCPHHPDDQCLCRKPRIGLLKNAAQELNLDLKKCFFVGDTLKDIQAGTRAGCRTILVQTGQGQETLKKILAGKTRVRPDWVCEDLPAATTLLLTGLKRDNP